MTEFRFLNGEGATRYVAPVAVRLWAANGLAADATSVSQSPGSAESAGIGSIGLLPERDCAPDTQEQIRQQITDLTRHHRELDQQIGAVSASEQTKPDELAVRRLKKQKLMLKDRIAALQMLLVPDIPA